MEDIRVVSVLMHLAGMYVLNKMERFRQQSRKWQCRNDGCPLPRCRVVVMQYLLGAGGTMSGGGGHDVGGFDELRPVLLLSIGPILKMDSNMQHDDVSWLQHIYWLWDTTPITSKIRWNNQSLPENVCVTLIIHMFRLLFDSLCRGRWLGYDGNIRMQAATCWPNSRTEGENPTGHRF